jgi:hypothetical protein
MVDVAQQYLDANPPAEDVFTTDKQEAIRRGIYYKPLCACGCGAPAEYQLGTRPRKVLYIASWDCRNRVSRAGLTRCTSMHGFGGMVYVQISKETGEVIPPEQ